MHTLKKLTFLLVGTVLFLQTALVGVVSAAGSAAVTAEGASALNPGDETNIDLFVTPSGANIYAIELRVNLTNLTYVSSSLSGSNTDFFLAMPAAEANGYVDLVASSTGAFGPSAGLSGKSKIGRIRVKAVSSGSASISFSSVQAADGNNQPMSSSGQTKSMTVNGTQESGEEGMGSDPGDDPVNDHGSGNTDSDPKPSTGTVPSTDTPPKKQDMDVAEFIAVSAEDNDSTPGQELAVATTKKLPLRTIGLVSTIAALVVCVVGGSALLISRQRKLAEINRHVASYVPSQPAVPTAAVQPQSPVPDNKPVVQQSQEPTIIKPTETGGKDPEA